MLWQSLAAGVQSGHTILPKEHDQSFTRFLVENDWVDVLTRVSHEPHALFTALDKYLGSYLQNTEFHFQMRQFIAFYAVSRNLDAFLHSLRAAENSTQPDAFNLVFSPNANPALSGTGIVAPPLIGMLGMGTCQLLRELYRLGRLKIRTATSSLLLPFARFAGFAHNFLALRKDMPAPLLL